MAKRRHATMARFEGAATGIGGIITAVPDVVLLAWIQSRLVFFVAAAYGFDPHDPMRPAELLVLRDLYPDPETARRALDGMGKTVAEAYVGTKLDRVGRERAMLSRLMMFVGKRTAARAARRLIPASRWRSTRSPTSATPARSRTRRSSSTAVSERQLRWVGSDGSAARPS